MTATRIYTVSAYGGKWHLVRATSRAQAISHVARNEYSVSVASQDEIVSGMEAGIPIQTANEKEGKANG